MTIHHLFRFLFIMLAAGASACAEDGYRLWLRYDRIEDDRIRSALADHVAHVVIATPDGSSSPRLEIAMDELRAGLGSMLGIDASCEIATTTSDPALGDEGFRIDSVPGSAPRLSANSDTGILYAAFELLRRIQTHTPVESLGLVSTPRVSRRVLNHWDNLNRFVERGYAGFSLWEWPYLPEIRSPRYRDYARACASIGINGTVLTNVNANAVVLTPEYLAKVAALADELRPYGIRVYLTARFSAPIQIGGLKTADPLDPEVAAWWKAKIDEIYTFIPDFGGFVVKANSEGQPGPQDYGRNHADGANMMADALAPHGGIVMWRAFVYQPESTIDRVRQANVEFDPLDGKFRDNVSIQIKNGPLDFMPREPFHPLFGTLKKTSLTLELQITQEYLGASLQLVYLAPLWKEVLDAETYAQGPGSTVARVVDGSVYDRQLGVFAGVANIGTDRNWTGHPLAQTNWYAFGRLAWDHTLTSEQIADEWVRMTFSNDPALVEPLKKMLLGSHETAVNYSMPLGLHHIMEVGHHYGPGPWVTGGRPDWTSPYYHQADEIGLGAARSAGGSNAIADYAPELAKLWGNIETCPEELLLWFHHVPWDHTMNSGRTLWDELCLRYQQGVDEVRAMQREWDALAPGIDAERHLEVKQRLARQERDAREWRDACLLYFQQFSKRPLPAGVEPPEHDLQHYIDVNLRYFPGHPGDY